jgi:hypothetical protein
LCFAPFPLLTSSSPIYASHNALLYLFVSLDAQASASITRNITLQALFYKAQKYFKKILDSQ